MEQYSASHTTSRNSSLPHNRREENYTGKNVDRNGIHEQWFRKEITDLYSELFSDSIMRYNAKQKRADRKIKDSNEYLERVQKEWDDYYKKGIWEKGEFVRPFNDYNDALNHLNYNKGRNPRSPYYETIVQIGNQENQPDFEISKAILKEYLDTFQERNPNLRLMECHFHGDEATPHIHLDFVPIATGYKQGMDIQNGFDKALMQQMGIGPSGTKFKTPSLQWYEQEQEALAEIALKYGIEISSDKVLEPGKKEHESVKAYKERMETVKELNDELEFVRTRRKSVSEREKNVSKREESVGARESAVAAREGAVGVKEAELMRGASERLLEARRALERAEAEKERLEQENARRRAEIAELDGIELQNIDKLILIYLQTHAMQNGDSFYNGYKNLVLKERKKNESNKGIPDAVSDYGSSKNYQPNQTSKQNNRQLDR
jgi:hypothetical protein